MKYILLLLLPLLLFSCDNESTSTIEEQEEPVVTKKETFLSISSWLLGSWKYEKENKAIAEQWTQESDSLFKGKGEFIFNGEVVNTEVLEIREEKGQLYYCAIVANQNEGKEIKFLLTDFSDTNLLFEKPDHDFPQKIHYTYMPDEDEVVVELTGLVDGEISNQIYIFQRQK